jgi:hypothetical protein
VVLTGYMLAFATVIPLTGWAAALIGATLVPGLLLPRPRRQAATQERI